MIIYISIWYLFQYEKFIVRMIVGTAEKEQVKDRFKLNRWFFFGKYVV